MTFDIPAANEPTAALATKSPRRMHVLEVQIVPVTEEARCSLGSDFWRLMGELAAEVLLDGVSGPWDETDDARSGRLAA